MMTPDDQKHYDIDVLIVRYYDGLTTDAEEALLKRFLTSSAGSDARYDEVRAVMGFLATGRSLHAKERAGHRVVRVSTVRRRLVAAAAAVVLMLGASWGVYHYLSPEADCIAYVNGTTVTDPELVRQEMQQCIEAVDYVADEDVVAAHMADMLGDGIELK